MQPMVLLWKAIYLSEPAMPSRLGTGNYSEPLFIGFIRCCLLSWILAWLITCATHWFQFQQYPWTALWIDAGMALRGCFYLLSVLVVCKPFSGAYWSPAYRRLALSCTVWLCDGILALLLCWNRVILMIVYNMLCKCICWENKR